jgi:hypothetical protein
MTWFWVTVGKQSIDVTPDILYHLATRYGQPYKTWTYYSKKTNKQRTGSNRAKWIHLGRKIGFRQILDAETFRTDLTFLLLKANDVQSNGIYGRNCS